MTRPAVVAEGTVRAPPSKSVTHRAHLLAARTTGSAEVVEPLRAADTDTTLDCLRRLGADATDDGDRVRYRAAPLHAAPDGLDCGNSGTTLRLLLGQAATLDGTTRFDGDASLRGRTNKALLDVLRAHGAPVDGTDLLPLAVGGGLRPGEVRFPHAPSSQFVSSLLLALPFLDDDSTVLVPRPVASKPYLDVTVRTAAAFGIHLEEQDDAADGPLRYAVPGGQRVRDASFRVDGDWSGAAFPFVAAAVTGGTVTVDGLDPDSPQGDKAVLPLLAAFGASVHGTTVAGPGVGALESPGTVDVSDTPDLFPALAVVAACAAGTTTFTGGRALRHKESDRIAAMAEGLDRLGVPVQQRPDGLVVEGGHPLRGASVRGFHDHRIHMALRVAGLVADGPVEVSDPDSVAISYPDFHDHLARLTGRTEPEAVA